MASVLPHNFMTLLRRLALSALMALSLATGSLAFLPTVAFAQGTDPVSGGLAAVGGTVNLSATDPRVIASRIINVTLGLLGLVTVVIILYAGFQWMTSGGEAEKVETAKKRLRNAVIGLIIILSAYALTAFVINALSGATGVGTGDTTGGPTAPPGGFGTPPTPSNVFRVRSIKPSGAVRLRNVEVRFLFTGNIAQSVASSAITVIQASSSLPVAGTVTVSGSMATFVPSAACPAPYAGLQCFDADTAFIARVATGTLSLSGLPLTCGGFAPPCESHFYTGNLIDTAPPSGSITYPLDGHGVSVDALVMVQTSSTDDSGVSDVETFDGSTSIGFGTEISSSPSTLLTEAEWDTTGATLGSHALSSRIHDLDSHTADTARVNVVVRAAHCFNATIDTDLGETALNCGGECAACVGGSCTSGALCASGDCSGGVCVELPVITFVSPSSGRVSTMVSISGENFGTTPGTVKFFNNITATAPAACASAGSPMWSPTQVVVSVPVGAVDGPISITNSAGSTDTTNDARGPVLRNFDVNDVAHPGLCAVVPDSGEARAAIALVGVGLGATPDRVTFSDRAVSSIVSWTDSRVAITAPLFSPALYAVKAFVGSVESNTLNFRLNAPTTVTAPIIDALTPNNGPIGEYVTVQGRNFGRLAGTVFFRRGDGEATADISFPPQCSVAFWSDTSVTIKVPPTFRQGLPTATALTDGEWQVKLKPQATTAAESNALPFTVNHNPPRPGICAVQPSAGPIGTPIEIFGERFGAFATGQASFSGTTDRVAMSIPAASAATDWTNGRIAGNVPVGSKTGPVQVRQGTTVSNGVPFAVRNCNEDAAICGAGEVCCRTGACFVGTSCPAASPTAEFAWRLSTGILPVNPRVIEECEISRLASPSPWSGRTGGDRACVNADLIVRFTTPIKPASVVPSGADATFLVRKCTDSACATASPTPVAGGLSFAEESGTGLVIFRPSVFWEGDSTYQVILTTGIHALSTDLPMLADYRFTFSTRGATDLCRVGAVNVIPGSVTLNDLGVTQPELAATRSADDICVSPRADAYNWTWASSNSGQAEITHNFVTLAGGVHRGLENQTSTALMETGTVPVHMSAAMTQDGETVSGIGDLFVRLQPPRVVAHGPDCDQACTNALVWARFSTGLDPASVTDNIKLDRCTNEDCTDTDLDLISHMTRSPELMVTPDSITGVLNYISINPTGVGGISLLDVGRFYRVTLRGGDSSGIRSNNGLPLAGGDFTWTFRVKTGEAARCATDHISVTPGQKVESSVGARQTFRATPVSAPDACNAEGQPIVDDREFVWSVEQTTNVSHLVKSNAAGTAVVSGPVDTVASRVALPAGCSGRCLNLGSNGAVGHVASCGNGIIETTDAHYCSGGFTPFSTPTSPIPCTLLPAGSRGAEECDDATSACNANCLWAPMAAGTCGNNIVNIGEQCDKGLTGGPGCSASCQLLGSRAGGSTCGNGDIASGEACDDSNTVSGDGCSSDCLHEGSVVVRAMCGNAVLETGESCERPSAGVDFPAGCNQTTCLHEGTVPLVCGNAVVNAGEDCDDGNTIAGDGCSARCLKEGSSTSYPDASFCGDGVRGRGEMCEASVSGDGRQDAVQLAEIVGAGVPDATTGLLSSQIKAVYDTKTGQATYGLQCGYHEESSCSGANGLDASGCCAPRPVLASTYPADRQGMDPGTEGVCRNVLMNATFNVLMDQATVTANFYVARDAVVGGCVSGEQLVSRIEDYDPTPGFRGWMNRTWNRLMAWFRPKAADAATWCAGQVRGRLEFRPAGDTTSVDFILENALSGSTNYQVLFKGDADTTDNASMANRLGIKSARGVVANSNLKWEFRTGLRLCDVSAIEMQDVVVDSPNLFTRPMEAHWYRAQAISVQRGVSVPLSPVAEYGWIWEPWISSNLDLRVGAAIVADVSTNWSEITTVATPKNGSAFLEAGIKITQDAVNVPSSTGRIIKGSQTIQIMLCSTPWPGFEYGAFSETHYHPSLWSSLIGSSALATDIRNNGPYFNFSTLYCRDTGSPGSGSALLPILQVQPVTVSASDLALGILRQYLFTFKASTYPALVGDGIGIRVATNPLHLSPSAWYKSRGFTGQPELTTVDGFEAVKAGATWYVGGFNLVAATNRAYSQIYIISYNPDAKEETKKIAAQMVSNFTLNTFMLGGSSNVCTFAVSGGGHSYGEIYRATSMDPATRCTADWECVAKDSRTHCLSFKAKAQRDLKRIADFQFMTDALESARARNGSYPQLMSGTFVPTMSTSRWPSWSAQLQSETGVAFPSDPVNRFLTCGTCAAGRTPCQDSSECASGDSCVAAAGREGIEPATCWNPAPTPPLTPRYVCPRLNAAIPESSSRIYQYRSVNAGTRYELSTEFETGLAGSFVPPLLTEIKKCSNLDVICNSASDCDVRHGIDVVSSGTCNGTGGTWSYYGVCAGGAVYGTRGVCGDGVIGTGELCEIGDTKPLSCHVSGTSGADLNGTKLQTCNDCGRAAATAWVDGPATRCVLNTQCGNGRVDAGESCDDGALNGSYGHCNRTCNGYGGYCGDGGISPGETCDRGSDLVTGNGAYCRNGCDASTSCNLSCTGPGPRCGDGEVNGGDQCDGNAERTTSAVCEGGPNYDEVCTTDADCPSGVCGNPAFGTASCVGVTALRCSNDRTKECTATTIDVDCGSAPSTEPAYRCISYPTSRTRSCVAYGDSASAPEEWCTWNGWSACEPTNYCGDGIVDTGETCDDGNRINNDACTNACRPNICGDGVYYTGVEECDLGTTGLVTTGATPQNGTRSCSADYGSSCLSCSTSCRQVASSGGYCGNGVKEGSEQCDGTQGLGSCSGDSTVSCTTDAACAAVAAGTCNLISCRGLGFDYSTGIQCAYREYFLQPDGEVYAYRGSQPSATIGKVHLETSYPGITWPVGTQHFFGSTTLVRPLALGLAPLCYPDSPPRDLLTCASSCSLSGCSRCGDTPGTGTISGQVLDAVNYVYPVPNARVTLYNRGVPVTGGQMVTDNDGRFRFTTLDNNNACVSYRIVVDFYQDNPCTGTHSADITCDGKLWGDWLGTADESVNGGYWPYESGTFGVSTFQSRGLNNNTGKIYLMPRVQAGETLVVAQFVDSRSISPWIVFPQTSAFKGTSVWPAYPVLAGRELQCGDGRFPADVATPECQAWHLTNYKNANKGTYEGCTLPAEATKGYDKTDYTRCLRTLWYAFQGNTNLEVVPHAENVCRREEQGVIVPACNNETKGPFVTRFKTDPRWYSSGYINYFLVDKTTNDTPSSLEYFKQASTTVTIVTQDRIRVLSPPESPTCTPAPGTADRGSGDAAVLFRSQNPSDPYPAENAAHVPICGDQTDDATGGIGKYWLVFQANAATGDINLTNQGLCRGSAIPGEPAGLQSLPWPLLWSDCSYGDPRTY